MKHKPGTQKKIRFDDFFDEIGVNGTLTPEEKKRVERAFEFARRHYCKTPDLDGDRYLTHCLNLVTVLWKIKVDADTLCAAFLHALPRSIPNMEDRIENEFGLEIAKLVRGVQNFRILPQTDDDQKKSDLEHLFENMSRDLRIVFLRLSHRLYELEHAGHLSRDGRISLARETLEIYIPLARRLGMGAMRAKLENQAFRLFRPRIYRKLNKRLKIVNKEDEVCLSLMVEAIQRVMDNNGIQAQVEGRVKNLFSIYRKMVIKKLSFEEVTDKIAIRIIVEDVISCYNILGLLHIHFTPIPGTFDDYIARPKINGYQSLHTCVYPVPDISYKPVEIQIRTEEMHRKAEFGAAAHWNYKQDDTFDRIFEEQKRWIGSLIPMRNQFATHHRFTDALRKSVVRDPMVVFDEEGSVVRLPRNSQVRDFIQLKGSNLPKEKYIARVNGHLCGMNHRLRDGDTVEILHGPQK
jgi:RelA/SpoT family (p)ppGpp synthetase